MPWAIKVALEMASSFIGQEGQPLHLLAIKLSIVSTNSDVTVPKVGLLSNRTDIHGKIYHRLRWVAAATYTATQLGFVGFVVNFIGRYDGNWIRREMRALAGSSIYAAWASRPQYRVKLTVYRVIDPESLLGSNSLPFSPSMAVAGSFPTNTTQNSLDTWLGKHKKTIRCIKTFCTPFL